MAKYSSFSYSTAKYGTGDAGPQPNYTGIYKWMVLVQWDGATWTNEADYACGMSYTRGKSNWVSTSGGGLESSQPGRLTVRVHNDTGRYDYYNTSSPIYPNAVPGKKIKIMVKDLASKVTYDRFTGWIEDIRPVSGGEEYCEIHAVDYLAILARMEATVELQQHVHAHDAIGYILDACEVGYSLLESAHPIAVFGIDQDNVLSAIEEITSASLGQFFVDNDGVPTYYSLSTDSMATHTIDEDNVLKIIETGQPWDERYNDILVYSNGWGKTATKLLYKAPKSIAVAPGGTESFTARWSEIAEPRAPIPGDDYDRYPYVSGGTILYAVTVTISAITAKSCLVTIVNSGPYPIATKIEIWGREIVSSAPAPNTGPQYRPFSNVPIPQPAAISFRKQHRQTAAGLSRRDYKTFVLDSQYLTSANFAAAYSTLLLAYLNAPRVSPRIQLQNCATPALQFGPDLQDKVTFTAATKSINSTFRVGEISEEWLTDNGQSVMTTIKLINVMSSSDSITEEEMDEIPDIPDEDGDDDELPPIEGDGCESDSPSNGPYSVPISGTFPVAESGSVQVGTFPCILRPPWYQYPSYVTWKAVVNSPLGTPTPVTFTLKALDAQAIQVAAGTVTQTGPGSFRGNFNGITIKTAMDAFSLMVSGATTYSYDFTDGLQGWSEFIQGGSGGSIAWNGSNGHTTNGCVYAVSGSGLASKIAGVQRVIPGNKVAIAGDYLSAWFYKITQSGPLPADGWCEVYFTDATQAYERITPVPATDWAECTVSLSGHAGKEVEKIAVYSESDSTETSEWYIDDITFVIEGQLYNGQTVEVSNFLAYNVCPLE